MFTFLCIESTIWRPKSVPISARPKRPCYIAVPTCLSTSTMVEKGEISKKRRTYCVAGAPNDVSYKNNIRITGIPIYHFPKGVAVWPK